MTTVSKLLFEKETYKIIGACLTVHKNLGTGFPEAVYLEALEKELSKVEIPFEQQKKLSIYYDGQKLEKHFVADFVCFDKIIITFAFEKVLNGELKHKVINYIKAAQLPIGLLINFGGNSLTWKRFINT